MNYLQLNDRGKFDQEEQALAEYFGEGEYKGFYKKHFLSSSPEVCKYDQWRKWSIEDFELDQEIKKKEFLLWKKGEEE